MSICLKSIVIVLALSMCTVASANPIQGFTGFSASQNQSWKNKYKQIKVKKQPQKPEPKAVPELNAAAAPLAALLLGGLLAAGVERRRRKSS